MSRITPSSADWGAMTVGLRWARMGEMLSAWARLWAGEICGLLYDDGPINVHNVALDPQADFAMDGDEQFRLMSMRGWPELVYHTHPGGRREPSSIDHANALPNVPYMIATPDGWAGIWVDGGQIQEVYMSKLTNDIVEVYKDGDAWSWRRLAPGNAQIGASSDSFSTKAEAARDSRDKNPDTVEETAATHDGSVGDPNAPVGAVDNVTGSAQSSGSSTAGDVIGPITGPGVGGVVG